MSANALAVKFTLFQNRASLGGRAKPGSVQTGNHQDGYRLSHAHMGTQFNSINL